MVHRGMTWEFNPKTGLWDLPLLNTDHFGVNVYEGHGDLRCMGQSTHYKDAGYEQKYAPNN